MAVSDSFNFIFFFILILKIVSQISLWFTHFTAGSSWIIYEKGGLTMVHSNEDVVEILHVLVKIHRLDDYCIITSVPMSCPFHTFAPITEQGLWPMECEPPFKYILFLLFPSFFLSVHKYIYFSSCSVQLVMIFFLSFLLEYNVQT